MPVLSRYGSFPELETEATLYTPDRSLPASMDESGETLGDRATEMLVVHIHPLEVGLYYLIAGRVLKIDRQSDYKEFLERCLNGPKLLRADRYRFYFGIPADEDIQF